MVFFLPVDGESGSGEVGVAGWIVVTQCSGDVLLDLSRVLLGRVGINHPVLSLHLPGERCHGVPAVPLLPACSPFKVRHASRILILRGT